MDIQEMLNTLGDELQGWVMGFVRLLPNLLVAAILGMILLVVSRGGRAAVKRGLARTKLHQSAQQLVVRITYFMALAGSLMVVLSVLELDGAVTSILAGAGVLGLALGFAFQDLAANIISGVGLSIRHPFNIGDIIETNGEMGVVYDITLRTTVMNTLDGKRVIIPNSKIYQEVLVNHSSNELRRMHIECGVSYDEDLALVKELAHEALQGLSSRSGQRDAEVFFTEFGGSSINFEGRVWFEFTSQKDLKACRDEAVMA
ncbi:MAG: mechanosensitive ion channel family protein, partial [Myxococcales bacterium]|nr:mechanosensitive ion channel family protein [Myxococcales bacterium]